MNRNNSAGPHRHSDDPIIYPVVGLLTWLPTGSLNAAKRELRIRFILKY